MTGPEHQRRKVASDFRRMTPADQARLWADLDGAERFDLLGSLRPDERAAIEDRLGGLGVGV